MITKRFKSIVLLSFIISVIVLFNSCLMGGVEKTGSRASVAFTVDEAMAQRIAAAAEEEGFSVSSAGSTSYRTLQRSVDYTNLFIDVAVKGDFEDSKTIQAIEDTSASFTSIPVGSSIYVEATAYYQNGENRTNLFEGQSKSFKVCEGENQVVFVLHRTSGSENGENGGNGGGEGGNGTVIPNVLPVNVIFIANSAAGGASGNDGTEESPLDSIENAIGKIKAIVEDANSGHANDEEWGIVLLSDLTGAQKVTTDADGFMSKLVIASKDSKAIKTIDGGFRSAPADVGNPAADTTGTTLTITSMTDVVLQCVKITGGWANYGGGIKHYGKNLYIKPGAEIYGNKARYNGAGIFVSRKYDENITVYEPIYLTLDGGLIGGDAGKENICTGREDGNYPGMGGGIYLSGLGEGTGQEKACLTIESGFIKGNKALYGGGLYEKGMCEVTMNDGTISGNSDNNEGGSGAGVYLDTDGNGIFALMGGSISSNTAASGGGIYATRTSLGIFGGNISGNTASSGKGAGIYFDKWNESPVFYIKDNPVFGTDDYIYIADYNSHSSLSTGFVLTPISLFDSLSGNGQIATIQLEQYQENDVIIKDSCNPAMSAADFAAACKRFKILPQTEDSSGNTLATPVKWGIDSTGKLQTKELNLYVSPSGTGDGSDLTVPFGSIDNAVTYLTNLESSGTNLTAKDITIFIDGTLTSKQTISGTLNADSLTIKGANGVDGEDFEPKDSIQSGGLEITLEGTPVVLNCIKLFSCNDGAITVGNDSNNHASLVLGDKVLIRGNYVSGRNVAPVYICRGASLTMKGGSSIFSNYNITGDLYYGECADAVFVDSGASFDMQGGLIYNNTFPKGGPMGIRSGIGVCVATGGSFSMGGAAALYKEGQIYYNDIYLSPGTKIHITKDLTSDQCVIMFDDTNASLGDVIIEAAAGVDLEAACKLFALSLRINPWYLGLDGKLTDVNPNTINFYIQQGGLGNGLSAASPFGSINEAVAAMTDMSADYILNINGQLSGAQIIDDFVSANAIYIKGTGNDAALTGGANVDNTLTIALDQYCSVPITISNIEISGAEETGLVVNNSKQQDAGINPLYRDVILKDGVQIINNGNGTDDYNGGGIYVGAKNILSISNDCIVEYNKAGSNGNGAGAYLYSYAFIELKDNVSFAANNDIYVPLTTSIMIGGPLSQSLVATITPCSYEPLTAVGAEPIIELGYEGFDAGGHPIYITTTSLAEVHSKFSVKPDGTDNYQIDDQGYLKSQ